MAAVLANLLGDAEILAASSANGVAQFKCAAGSNDGMSEFTTSLIANLDSGIYDFHKIAANIQSDANGTYASDIGLNLGLEDSGSAIFTGILPQLWEGPAFTGNLTNSAVTIGQLPPNMIRPQILNGIFEVTLTNIPNSGSIAIELSTNLVSWLQVSFNPATGTNQTFSFAVTNNNSAFFRALSVQ